MKDKLIWLVVFVVLAILAFLIDEPKGPEFLAGSVKRLLLAANLTLFLWLLNRFVGRPINASLEARQSSIQTELAQARDKLAEAERLRAEVDERLAKVETEVAEMRQRADDQGRAEAEKIDVQAREEEARFMKRVDEQIARRQNETRQQLARDTAALTAQLTKELLSSTMTEADQQRVLVRSLDALGNVADKE
ncbi:MAG TPA: ATP synthase F0 subunit B [Methylomirabilota bacterium]|nr:ATP synthase F0 subunit B [Methylomirabilota bacterium]